MPYSTEDKRACAERELKMRRRVYPRWVEEGRMSRAAADHETKVMAAILADYEEQATSERLL